MIILVALEVFTPICGPVSDSASTVTILRIQFSSLTMISILGHKGLSHTLRKKTMIVIKVQMLRTKTLEF